MKTTTCLGSDLQIGMRVYPWADLVGTIVNIHPYIGRHGFDKLLILECIHPNDNLGDGTEQFHVSICNHICSVVEDTRKTITSMSFDEILKNALVGKNLLRMGVDMGTITSAGFTISGDVRVYVGNKRYKISLVDEITVAF